jgi:hypothetical protein
MADRQLLETLLTMAGQAVPLIEAATGKGEAVSQALVVGGTIVRMIDSSRALFAETDQARLDALRDAIEQRVNDHADATIASLGGAQG